MSDGFHRVEAYRRAGRTTIQAQVRRGTKRDATFHALSANTRHGVRLTSADKRRAIQTMLRDPEWRLLSNCQIGDKAGASEGLVRKMRQELTEAEDVPVPDATIGADGILRRIKLAPYEVNRPDPVAPEPKPTGKSRVNGEMVDDPPDIAEQRAAGKIAPHIIPEITVPTEEGPTPEDIRQEHEERAAIQEDAPSDEEWLAALPLSSVLEGKPLRTFQKEALAYRELETYRRNFGRMVSQIRNQHHGVGSGGPYFYLLDRALAVTHPREWVRCAALDRGGYAGTGQV